MAVQSARTKGASPNRMNNAQSVNSAPGNTRKATPQNTAPAKAKPVSASTSDKVRLFYTKGKIDIPILVITFVLLVIGITIMFSASYGLAYSPEKENNSFVYFFDQVKYALIGTVLMFGISAIDYRIFVVEKKKFGITFNLSWLALIACLGLTIYTAFFGEQRGKDPDSPRRWITIGVQFQPSDLLKFALIIFMAYYIYKYYYRMKKFKYGWGYPLLLLAFVAVGLGFQPHMSCLVIVIVICGTMLIVGGISLKPAVLVGIVAVPAVVAVFAMSGFTYFIDRLKYTFDPLADIGDKTYQSYQSVLAVGSGGLTGVGLGNSTQKFSYLPEAQNDFVFSVWVEECGFIGGLVVILLFLLFVYRTFHIARNAEDHFGMLAATGIGVHFGLQAFLNIGVCVCCVPNTGISLPFFSYGGTALIVQMMEIGLLLSISRRAKLK